MGNIPGRQPPAEGNRGLAESLAWAIARLVTVEKQDATARADGSAPARADGKRCKRK